jgi:hypothetical protein
MEFGQFGLLGNASQAIDQRPPGRTAASSSSGGGRGLRRRMASSQPPTSIPGKDRSLLVHNPARTGFEIETPLKLLREDAITPAARSSCGTTSNPTGPRRPGCCPAGPWRLEAAGLLEFPRLVTAQTN